MSTLFSVGRWQRSKWSFHKWLFNKKAAIWNWGFYIKLWGYKNLEVEWTTNSIYYFHIGGSFWWTRKGRGDHHGWNLDLNLGWWELSVHFYDSRHVEHVLGESDEKNVQVFKRQP